MQDKIPDLHDNNRFTGPGIAVINRYYLTEPHDLPYPVLYNITQFDRRLIEMLGIRFFLTHELLPAQPGVTLRLTEKVSDRLTQYLYETHDPNVGNFSPTEQVVHSSAAEALERIGNSTFDFRKSVLVRERIPGSLVPAKATRLKIVGDRLDLEAESDGKSLVVLPFEYSHCLMAENKPSWTANPPELVRVNLDQIGVVFHRGTRVTLKFQFDPFNAECRRVDFRDWTEMNIRELRNFRGISLIGGYAK